MTIDLAREIHAKTDDRFFVNRILSSIKQKGVLRGSLMAGGLLAMKVYALGVSYFCIEGSVRSLIELAENHHPFERIRPLGDAGGWTAIVIFTSIALGTVTIQLIREGEYCKLGPICQKWLEGSPRPPKDIYRILTRLFDAYSHQCLFSKSLVTRRLKVLKVCEEANLEKKGIHRKDDQLKDILVRIEKDLKKVSSCRGYFRRLVHGQKSIRKDGVSRCLISVIMGVAIPMILLVLASISVVGEVGLGEMIFYAREDLGDTGHLGEWPFNAIEILGVAFLLHYWCMIDEGEFKMTRNIYKRYLSELTDDKILHNRLCAIANKHLAERQGYFFKLPLDYQFKKI